MEKYKRQGKKSNLQNVRVCLSLLVAVIVLGGQVSCKLLTPSPQDLPDYTNSTGMILDYAVGDRFELLKPMFLTKSGLRSFYLTEPGLGAPSLEQYAQDPKRYGEVVRLVPPGTQIYLVAIKGGGRYPSWVVYGLLNGGTEWVGLSIDKYTQVGTRQHLTYNREYYRKLEW